MIQCIPIDEVAYANAPRNDDTLSIEVCHADDTGKFNDASYESVVKLTAWLCKQLKLKSSDVVRHYDINGKQCPKYYVEVAMRKISIGDVMGLSWTSTRRRGELSSIDSG